MRKLTKTISKLISQDTKSDKKQSDYKSFDQIKTENIVEITFDDPAQYDTNYDASFEPVECITIGWLQKQTSDVVTIAWLKETVDEPYVGLAIPAGCVKKIRTLLNGSKKRRLF